MTGINHLALQMTLGLARKQACHSVTLPVMCPCSLRQICPPLLWEFRAGEYTRRRIADVPSRPADTERLLLKFVRLTAHVNRNLNAFWLTTSIRNMFLNFTCILSFFFVRRRSGKTRAWENRDNNNDHYLIAENSFQRNGNKCKVREKPTRSVRYQISEKIE